MRLTRYGRREWLTISLVALAAACVFVFLSWWWAIAVVAIIWAAAASFFRDPSRRVPDSLPPQVMLSPADGTVSAVTRVAHHDAVDGPAVIVRIFLSVLNVHVNRSPCDAVVVSISHSPGRYLDARREESARVNESNLIVLRAEDGMPLGVRQVAGKIARRIVCELNAGDRVMRGQRFGMIKFGSTTELILPDSPGVKVYVNVGEPVRGGLTQLAVTPLRAPSPAPTAGTAGLQPA
jgi:phosphatidylserine decarboxylase